MSYLRHYEKRIIPINVRIVLLFGRFATLFGIAFIAFSLFFMFAFSASINFETLEKNAPTTEGVIVEISPTNTSVNEQQVNAFKYNHRFS